MRIGFFGGSFNPPHIGHLILAQSALEGLHLDRVLFVPAYQSPFKAEMPEVAIEHRLEMLALALSDHKQFAMSRMEIDRQGVSYTIDSLRTLHAETPGTELVLLMGADAFLDFPHWMNPDDIVKEARLGVAQRPGHPIDMETHPFSGYADAFEMPHIGISSTSVRDYLRRGSSIRYYVPWTVSTYIEAHRLYGR